jgi:FkbM family methyltransferase
MSGAAAPPVRAALRKRVRLLRERRFERRLAGWKLLRAFARQYPAAVFVEVGANDGDQHDKLREHIRSRQWRGLMVEPVPYVFERLRRNYADLARVVPVNAAVGEQNGTVPIYHLVEADDPQAAGLPDWYDGLGSFSRQVLLDHVNEIPDIGRRIVKTEVRCVTFDALCEENGIESLDLLALDTEGHDWRILRSVDFDHYAPRVVIYEHFHLGDVERAKARAQMRAAGYGVIEEHFDTFCLDLTLDDRLTRLWSRLRPALAPISASEVRA